MSKIIDTSAARKHVNDSIKDTRKYMALVSDISEGEFDALCDDFLELYQQDPALVIIYLLSRSIHNGTNAGIFAQTIESLGNNVTLLHEYLQGVPKSEQN